MENVLYMFKYYVKNYNTKSVKINNIIFYLIGSYIHNDKYYYRLYSIYKSNINQIDCYMKDDIYYIENEPVHYELQKFIIANINNISILEPPIKPNEKVKYTNIESDFFDIFTIKKRINYPLTEYEILLLHLMKKYNDNNKIFKKYIKSYSKSYYKKNIFSDYDCYEIITESDLYYYVIMYHNKILQIIPYNLNVNMYGLYENLLNINLTI
jgi:hypothetical protein